jgi:hypothetical protein
VRSLPLSVCPGLKAAARVPQGNAWGQLTNVFLPNIASASRYRTVDNWDQVNQRHRVDPVVRNMTCPQFRLGVILDIRCRARDNARSPGFGVHGSFVIDTSANSGTTVLV